MKQNRITSWKNKGLIIPCIIALLIIFVGTGISLSFIGVEDTGNRLGSVLGCTITPLADETGLVSSIALTITGCEQNSGCSISYRDLQVELTDPNGVTWDVVLCGSLDFSEEISTKSPFYLVKRNKPFFFIVDNPTQGGCGGGGGGGSREGATNKEITPEGIWELKIKGVHSDTWHSATFMIPLDDH